MRTGTYARETSVSPDKSRAEIEKILSRYGATGLSWMVLPNGQTVGQWMAPQIEIIYEGGKMPPLLPSGDI